MDGGSVGKKDRIRPPDLKTERMRTKKAAGMGNKRNKR